MVFTFLINNISISNGWYAKLYFLSYIDILRLDYRLCVVILEKVLDLKKNIDVSNRYIGRHRTLPIYRIEKNLCFFRSGSME